MKPLKIRRTRFDRLPERYREAIDSASDCLEVRSSCPIRIETYPISDIRYLLEQAWGWAATIADIRKHWLAHYPKPNAETNAQIRQEQNRVRRIMRLIPKEGLWPYVSYWADDILELMEVTRQPNGEISVPNHGDGWHRMIAAIELRLPTFEILFLCDRPTFRTD